VAKIASDFQKPDGLTFIGPSKIVSFLEKLPIEKFFGVGKVTAKKMNQMGIFNGHDLKRFSEIEMIQHFGKSGKFFYQIVRGEDNRPVKPNRISKSIGVEDTFETDLREREDMVEEIKRISSKLFKRLKKAEKFGKTITLKVKFGDFTQITRSRTFFTPMEQLMDIENQALDLLDKLDLQESRVRLLGVTISNFHDLEAVEEGYQLTLF